MIFAMKTHAHEPRCFDFYVANLDTHVRVEESAGAVLVRASRNTFSEGRKLSFIRELAAEGFIADEYYWHPLAGRGAFHGARWQVDYAWLLPDPALAARARRQLAKTLLVAAALWLALMGPLVLGLRH
jgi:hypothetical protein